MPAQPETRDGQAPWAPGLLCCTHAVHTCVTKLEAVSQGLLNLETMVGLPGGL